MIVQMIDGLPAVLAAIDYNAIAAFGNAELICQLLNGKPYVPKQLCILRMKTVDIDYRFLGNN